ncbi:type II toxin-antitoxin system VapC family toxin [Terrarubrum flagellatum]|uniref:type II toxin-antitoxin system VapC family toxin n=1 Tax=Terrirubrum flagellatum TaxID=2895980 RepID=UPI003145125E
MIALDSSALVSVAIEEEGFEQFEHTISSHRCVVGAPTLQEIYMVLCGKPDIDPVIFIERTLSLPTISVVAFTRSHFDVSRLAFDLFGRGRGHPAKLNFGDCLSYAVAKVADVPLLFRGKDFDQTDIRAALLS